MSTVNILNHLIKVEQDLNNSMRLPLVEPEAFITWKGIKMISEGSLVSIQGKSGSHKSRLAQEIASVLLAPRASTPTALGMIRSDDDPITVVHLDSERNSVFELPYALKSISTASGTTIPNPNFRCTSLRDLDRNERGLAAGKFIDHVRSTCDGKLCVIVDVATDILSDFNSVTETGKVVDMFKKWMNHYRCAIIAVIHENPGSDKMRGHLGTEILNKATDALSIKVDKKDDIQIKFEKCRSYKRPRCIDVVFNESTGRLEITNQCSTSSVKEQFVKILEDIYSKSPKYTRKQIIELTQSLGRSVDSIDTYLDEIKSLSIGGKSFDFVKGKDGKEATYEIKESQAVQLTEPGQ